LDGVMPIAQEDCRVNGLNEAAIGVAVEDVLEIVEAESGT